MPRLGRIVVYPIKSLDGVEQTTASFLDGAGLQNDRRFRLVDSAGNTVNGKRHVAVHTIRARYSSDFSTVTLSAPAIPPTEFRLAADEVELCAALSAHFGFAVRVEENRTDGFPDDGDSQGPTVVSTASLETVARWFPPLDLDEVRRRFRANLELEDCPAFWEDRLFAPDATPAAREVVPFRIGAVELLGVNPCARCIVPTRDARTGESTPRFAQEFQRRRRETMPAWVAETAFDHYYRLTVNTRPSPRSPAGRIAVGDAVDVVTD